MKSVVVNSNSIFSSCDNIAQYYDAMGVTSKKTTGPLGGKSFTWEFSKEGRPYRVTCECSTKTLTYGKLTVQSILNRQGDACYFKGTPAVDPKTSAFIANSPIGMKKHTFSLPRPD